MKDLLDKLTSYNLFNYLLPGVVFVALIDKLTSYHLIQENIVIGVFVYYFIGSIISRIGSIFIEPLLKQVKFVTFAQYSDFVTAAKEDPKIEILSEQNNMYRTFCAMVLLIVAVAAFERLSKEFSISQEFGGYIMLATLFVLYLFSYRKQTNYITKRVQHKRTK